MVVVDGEGELHVAGISEADGWPAFVVGDELRLFPGRSDLPAYDLAITSGPDDMLHAAWTNGQTLYYGRVRPQLRRATAIVEVFQGQIRDPEIAVSSDGDVVIGGVAGNGRQSNSRVELFRGRAEQGFRGPERVLPTTPNREAFLINLGTINVEFGRVGVTYVVTDAEGTRAVFVRERRGWYAQTIISDVAQRDAASFVELGRYQQMLSVDSTGERLRLHALYGERYTTDELHRLDSITSAHLRRDDTGVLHVMVNGMDGGTGVVDYIQVGFRGPMPAERLVTGEGNQAVYLDFGAGAMALTESGPVAVVTQLHDRGNQVRLVRPASAE